MFEELEKINTRPKPFEFYTASDLWAEEHTSKQMLSFHLNEEIDVSSRNAAFIDRSVEWIASRFNVGAETKIADFGCGPGLYTMRLAKKQADVTGIDFSKRSIQYAHDHQDEMKAILRFKLQIILIYIANGHPFPGCNFLCVLNRALRKIYSGHFRLLFSQPH